MGLPARIKVFGRYWLAPGPDCRDSQRRGLKRGLRLPAPHRFPPIRMLGSVSGPYFRAGLVPTPHLLARRDQEVPCTLRLPVSLDYPRGRKIPRLRVARKFAAL